MNRTRGLALAAASALLLGACTSAAGPSWTFPPDGGATGALAPTTDAQPAAAATPAAAAAGGATSTAPLAVDAVDIGFQPTALSVPAPGAYAITLHNTGTVAHDLTFADGTKITAQAGTSATGTVNVPAGGISFICSVPGHAAAGMQGTITVAAAQASASPMPGMATTTGASNTAGAAAPQPDPAAPPYVLRDATAPALMPGTVHDVDFPIVDKDITVATGFVVHAWTFGGTVPGPTLHVHLGDTVRVHLTNETQMSHSIDFHASQTAMNHQMVEIKPGATFTYTFTADYAGVWMYHCGTAPALEHIANGMFGMVIVEPKGGLPKVDKEVAIVQSEWYLGAQGQIADYAKANSTAPAPDFVVFNGVANQYKDNPIAVPTKGRVRVYVLDAGPNLDSSFHVVGTIFDTVIKEGIELQRGNPGGWGSQAVDLSPAQGAIIEFSPQEDGMYPFVTHAFNLVGHGAIGVFMAGDGKP